MISHRPLMEKTMEATTLKVTGMTCNHCVMAVTKALKNVPGVESADVSLDKAQAVVKGSADAQALIAAVKEEGYGATLPG
jgi:copper chaperone